MERLFRRKLQVFVWVVTMMLSVLLFSTYTDEMAQVQEEKLPEAEAALPSSAEESQQNEGADAVEESTVPETEIPIAEPSPEPTSTPEPTPEATPMPMFDIIDGRTIYLSITEEEFIEISEFLRAGLGINDAALAVIALHQTLAFKLFFSYYVHGASLCFRGREFDIGQSPVELPVYIHGIVMHLVGHGYTDIGVRENLHGQRIAEFLSFNDGVEVPRMVAKPECSGKIAENCIVKKGHGFGFHIMFQCIFGHVIFCIVPKQQGKLLAINLRAIRSFDILDRLEP